MLLIRNNGNEKLSSETEGDNDDQNFIVWWISTTWCQSYSCWQHLSTNKQTHDRKQIMGTCCVWTSDEWNTSDEQRSCSLRVENHTKWVHLTYWRRDTVNNNTRSKTVELQTLLGFPPVLHTSGAVRIGYSTEFRGQRLRKGHRKSSSLSVDAPCRQRYYLR